MFIRKYNLKLFFPIIIKMVTSKVKINMVKRAIRAFLKGRENISWTTGVIIHSRIDKETLKEVLDELKDYGDKLLFQNLVERCNERELL